MSATLPGLVFSSKSSKVSLRSCGGIGIRARLRSVSRKRWEFKSPHDHKYLFMKPTSQSPDFPDAFYRVSVKGIYVKDGKILMTYDDSNSKPVDDDPWELPGGGLDFGEEMHTALKREVEEEMGLEVTSVSEKPLYVWPVKHGVGRGMDWYWVLVVAFKIDFKDLNFTPTRECQEIKFFSIDEIKEKLPQISNQIRPLAEHFNLADFT